MGRTSTTNTTNPEDEDVALYNYAYLSQPTPQFADLRDAIEKYYTDFHARSDGTMPSIRALAGDDDAAMPPGGPDRSRQVTSELLQFPARDGHSVELKVYRSAESRRENATLMYKMHGGGTCNVHDYRPLQRDLFF